MDCQMPVLDGYQATAKIRTLPGYENLPIFALTADVTQEGKERANLAGFTGHLSKPIIIDNVLKAFAKI
jgi:CheY-like chemotaxis protein